MPIAQRTWTILPGLLSVWADFIDYVAVGAHAQASASLHLLRSANGCWLVLHEAVP